LVNSGYRIPEGRSLILILASVLRVRKEAETTHVLLLKKAVVLLGPLGWEPHHMLPGRGERTSLATSTRQYDGTYINHQQRRRFVPDVSGMEGHLDWNFTDIGEEKIRRVNSLKLGTWNVRTLNTTGKEELLERECKKFDMNFVGLTETMQKGPGGHYYTHKGSFVMHSKAENREHRVGTVVDKWTAKKVIGYEGISDRIMIV